MPRPRAQMAAGGAESAPSFVGYYRVSTAKQGRSGLGLDAQRAAVAQRIGNGRLVEQFTEVESGKQNSRPQLALALASCRARRATLIVAKLDRLARNALFLLTVVEGTGEGGVVFGDLPELPPGPMGKFIVGIMAQVAELEAGLISERTKSALAEVAKAIKRDGGWRSKRSGNWITGLGGPKMTKGHAHIARVGRQAQSERAKQRAADVWPFIEQARQSGCASLRAIADRLTSWSIRPPSGGDRWHAQQVRRVIARSTQ